MPRERPWNRDNHQSSSNRKANAAAKAKYADPDNRLTGDDLLARQRELKAQAAARREAA